MPISRLGLVDRVDRLAERDARPQIERQRHRRELALVRHRQRPDLAGVDVDQRGQRHGAAGQRRLHIEPVERREVLLQLGQDFEHDEIGVELREILRDLALAEGVVERVVDHLRLDAEARGRVAVDGDLELRRIRPAGRSTTSASLRQRRASCRASSATTCSARADVGILQRVLELARRDAAADGDVLRRLQEQRWRPRPSRAAAAAGR